MYDKALKDCARQIQALSLRQEMEPEHLQTIIYQKQYQQMIARQISGIIKALDTQQYDTVLEFLQDSYVNGYVGTMFDIHGQGIPITVPIDQARTHRAITNDTKLSDNLYKSLQGGTARMKRRVQAEVSRGIAAGRSWYQISEKLAKGISGMDNPAYYAQRIARTEGHRIQQEAAYTAQQEAKKAGADVVKQWDATLDDRTREDHRTLDGTLAEVDEEFTVSGHKALYPGGFGVPSEDIHCRCAILQRARWALDDDELERLRQRAEHYRLHKSNSFQVFKDRYLQLPRNATENLSGGSKGFVPAKNMAEVRARMASALGIDENTIDLGSMEPKLANQYLEGVEIFMADFPEMKGLYTAMNTKRCSKGVFGVNTLEGRVFYVNGLPFCKCTFELGFWNPVNIHELEREYAYVAYSGQYYKNTSPKATAIHELVHGLTYAIEMRRNGYFVNGVLQTSIPSSEWYNYNKTSAPKIVMNTKQEMFGKIYGKDVYNSMSHLGLYALTSDDETIAQAVSYEYVNSDDSKEFSAKILKNLKKEVKEVFK